jgi:cystathionine gamma-lyase
MKFATRAIRGGQPVDDHTGAVVPSITVSSTFAFRGIEDRRAFEYARSGNPTRAALEECLALLEEGTHGLAYASGSAATVGVLSLLRPGDHVIATGDIYGGTFRIFEAIAGPGQQIGFTYVDAREPGAIGAAATSRTRMVWVESPTNPLLQVVDLERAAAEADQLGALLVVDNTFASPALQRPLTLGADVVLHSTTKYIGGHSDFVGGAVVVADDDLYAQLYEYQNAAGPVASPFDSWLALRGLKTLSLRMRAHCENAQAVAEYLRAHALVEKVIYPGLPDHPQHDLARRQMGGFGGMLSFYLRGGRREVDAFARSLELFSFAESLGGAESLACHPVTMTHATMSRVEQERRGITEGLVRLSAGLEDPEDLIGDLEQALAAAYVASS